MSPKLSLSVQNSFSDSVSIPVTCCYDVAHQKVHVRRLKSYRRITSTQCPREAVIFRTILDKDICADPKMKWVKDAIKRLDQKSLSQHP
ncbi:C-C motif chemokine 12-like [Acomys russatus]|uniref:C-C motif chemokine 12-like n=1 Tax=Acomys russatus TaxID=60746 RepID=UPI0021E2172A|nr:C-C motif chemokine 12-like [Acomys russatus]